MMAEEIEHLKQRLEQCAREREASEERFRNVIFKSADGILIVYKTGIIRFANPAAESLFGRKGDELLGAPFGFPVAAGETTEIDLIPKYAQTVVAEMRIVETEWEGETAYLASLRDITERKRAERQRAQLIREQAARAEAERTQKQIANILESITDGFIALDKQWRFTYANSEAEEMLERMREGIIGKSIWEEFPDLIGSRFDEQYRRAVAEQVTVEFEEFYPPLGIWLEICAYPSKEGISVYFRDVTRRKQAEAGLREQTEVVETINRIGQLLSAELDSQKLVQAVTDAATELCGAHFGSFFYNVYDEEGGAYMLYTLSGAPREAFAHFPMPRATDLFGPTFRGEGTICIDDVKKDPRYGKNSPYYGMPPGHLPVTSYLAVPVISRSGEVMGGLFFGHPDAGVFTERAARIVEGLAAQAAIAMDNARLYQNAQQALAEREDLLRREQAARKQAEVASRAKDEFLATLSHELRTPLNAIFGWTRLLAGQKLDDDACNRAIETIDRNAKLQARLIDDMLDVSRIISGKLRLETQPVDLPGVINAAVDTVRSAADAKSIRIEVVLGYDAGLVLGDPVRLQQVVWNLVSNAIKFTPKGGRVQVQLRRIDSHFEITVSDTGLGVDEKFLPYVFDRFRQADSTASREYGGLGLGLAIVRHLVELHGGTVEADNRAEGRGAVFTIRLPVMVVRKPKGVLTGESEGTHPSVSGSLPFDCPPALDGLKVLVVDDEADARELLSIILEQCGAEVKTYGSAAEALEALKQFEPDVLISDIGMPQEDGYVLIEKVRSLEPERGGRIPAVALTAYARAEDRLRALSAGYNMHVPKPVEPAELAVVIASLTGRSRKM
jgi:PAS domain S-box-containing protein